MDCEKFDRVVLDLLYDELDELTSAAAKRHVEHCSRCRTISGGLRATRSVGALKLVDPPEGLELKILEAEHGARARLPARQRLGRAVSIMASYAMRPQLAMAALLVLMIGSSLFFLRGQPGGRGNVLVTERGVPETESDSVAIVPTPERLPAGEASRQEQAHGALAAKPGASEGELEKDGRRERKAADSDALAAEPAANAARVAAKGGADAGTGNESEAYEAALGAYRDGRYVEAQRRFEDVANRGGNKAAQASLYAAQAMRSKSGCPAAAPLFAEVHARYRGSSVGSDAAWQAADCYQAIGEFSRARESYESLLSDSAYGDRAQAALSDLKEREQRQVATRAAARPTQAAAKAAKAKADAPAEQAAPKQAPAQTKPQAPAAGF